MNALAQAIPLLLPQVRTAHPSIMMNGVEYYNKLEPYFLTLAYTSSSDGQKADDLHLQLADRDGRFASDWMPKKGAFLDIGIIAERWYAPNAARITLDCGRLWIDEVELELPQHTVSIKATSIPTSSFLKATEATRHWDNTTLRKLAQQIVSENPPMTLNYPDSVYNPSYSAIEQTEQSSLEFLMHRARDANLAIKLFRGQLIVFDEEVIEKTAPSFSVVYGNNAPVASMACYRMTGGKFTTRLIDTLKKATVSHFDPAAGKVKTSDAIAGDADAVDDYHTQTNESTDGTDEETDGEANGGGDLREGEVPVGDYNSDSGSASGTRLARSILRRKNKDQVHGEIDLAIGNPLITSGQTFMLSGVGNYDGKWFAESVEHKCGPMFTSTIQGRKVLTGY